MRKIIFIATVCSALGAAPAMAQRARPWELGVDAGVSVGSDNPKVTTISLPVPAVRFGFYLSDRVSLEPKVAFNAVHVDYYTYSAYSATVGFLYHFRVQPIGIGPYARPFVGLVGAHSNGYSDTQTLYGGGLGLKIPFANNRFATRLEVNYEHMTAPRYGPATNRMGILVGISVFNR